jgi:hypothetical protein
MASLPYPFMVRDIYGNPVAGATLTVYGVTALSNGSTVSVTPTTLDLGDGDYVAYYDAQANGEAKIKFTATKSGANIAANPVVIATLDSSRIQTSLPAPAAAASGGLPTIGGGSGQINPDGAGNVSLSAAALQTIAQELCGISGTVWFVSTAGSDSNTGKSWGQAFLTPTHAASVAVAGDLIIVGPGTFALGATAINLPDHVSIYGAGKYVTFITSTIASDTGIVAPGSDSVVQDLNITGIASSGAFQAPIGKANGNTPTYALIRRCSLNADTDGIYFNNTVGGGTIDVVDCDISTKYDTLNASPTFGTITVNFYNVRSSAVGPSGGSSGLITRGIVASANSIVNVYGGYSYASNSGAGQTILCAAASEGGGLNCYGVRFNTVQSGSATTSADVVNGGGTVTLSDCLGSGTGGAVQTSGTIKLQNTSISAAGQIASGAIAGPQAFNNTGQTTNLPVDVQTIKGQTITATAGFSYDAQTTAQTNIGNISSGTTVIRANDFGGNHVALASSILTGAQIATAVWQDATSGDFTTAASAGKMLMTTLPADVLAIPTNPYTGTPPTTAQIATAVWQDVTSGSDFTTASSIGLLLATDINATISSRSTFAAGGPVNATQWGGVNVTGMPMPTYTQPTGFLAATFPTLVSSYAGGAVASVTAAVTVAASGIASPQAFNNTGQTSYLPANVMQIDGQSALASGSVTFPSIIGTSTLSAGAQMDLVNSPNATALSAIATAVWAATTRTLTGFGSLVASIAAAILKTPANLLATDSNGNVTGTIGGYASGQDPATLLTNSSGYLAAVANAIWTAATRTLSSFGSFVSAIAAAILKTPANLLATDSSGNVTFNNATGPVNVTIYSPVVAPGVVANIYRGDDYLAADGLAITGPITNYTGPSLAGATGEFKLLSIASPQVATAFATTAAINVSGTNVTFSADMHDTDTADLSPGIYPAFFKAILASGSVATRVVGVVNVLQAPQ